MYILSYINKNVTNSKSATSIMFLNVNRNKISAENYCLATLFPTPVREVLGFPLFVPEVL